MNTKTLATLIVINLALLAALGGVSFIAPPAQAQIPGGGRAGDYIMVAAVRSGQSYSTVYITDISNGIMLAVDPNPRGQLDVVTHRNLTRDFSGGSNR